MISLALLVVSLVSFYKFMTYDRRYTWSKEIDEEISIVANGRGFHVVEESEVSVSAINLPSERVLKINTQKILSKIHLMNYGHEFGRSILLRSKMPGELLNCKFWCLSDHVIGLEIEYYIVDEETVTGLKQEFGRQFSYYKIIWTKRTK